MQTACNRARTAPARYGRTPGGPLSTSPWFLRERVRRLVANCVLEDRAVEVARARLAALDAADQLTPYGLRIRAAIAVHDGDLPGAVGVLDRAIAAREEGDVDRDLERTMRLEVVVSLDPAAALAGFDALLAAEPTAARHHGRGVALERVGRIAEAAEAHRRAIALADNYDGSHLRVDLARVLRAQGDLDGAVAALQPALEFGSAEIRRAWADMLDAAGRTDEAAAARAELTGPGPADTRWLDAIPTLAALRDDPALAALGVRFVGRDEAAAGGDALRGHYAAGLHLGTLWVPSLWDACQQTVAPLTLLALGPTVPGRRHVGHLTDTVELYVDVADPTSVWISPNHGFPAALFTRVPSAPDAVAAALRALFVDRPAGVTDLPRVARAFMGYQHELVVPSPYSGELEQAGPHELERHFNFSPSADPLTWGTAYDDDPWPDVMPGVDSIQLVRLTRERRTQRPGAIARITRRTHVSRSHLGFEMHQPRTARFYVWHVRYRPNPYPDTIERFNAAAGTHFPTDLPADVVASVIGFQWMTLDELEGLLDQADASGDTAQGVAVWQVIAALRHDELAVTEDLRLVGDVAHRSGLPVWQLNHRASDLESVYFELTEGTNRNLGATADASSPAPTEGADR